jgi:hypothetical protein
MEEATREDRAGSRFSCTVRERALFEAGIKMGTIYHQFVGTPFSDRTVHELEEAMATAISVQPYVDSVEVRIVYPRTDSDDTYSYHSLTGDMIDAKVVVSIDGVSVTAEMRYDQDLRYPLMYISGIQD